MLELQSFVLGDCHATTLTTVAKLETLSSQLNNLENTLHNLLDLANLPLKTSEISSEDDFLKLFVSEQYESCVDFLNDRIGNEANLAQDWNNLAVCHHLLGHDYAVTLRCFITAHELISPGDDVSSMELLQRATVLANLAIVRINNQQETDNGSMTNLAPTEMLQRSLEVKKHLFGGTHPCTVANLATLAQSYVGLDYGECIRCFRDLLSAQVCFFIIRIFLIF